VAVLADTAEVTPAPPDLPNQSRLLYLSASKDLAPLERIMRDAMVFPLYDGGNQGVRRRQLHDILRHPGYDSMLAARGEGLPEDR
jgi:hypothetical protein